MADRRFRQSRLRNPRQGGIGFLAGRLDIICQRARRRLPAVDYLSAHAGLPGPKGRPPMTDTLSVRRRLVGSALRRYRESLGYDLGVAARILECHPSKISRIETGQRGIRPKELR